MTICIKCAKCNPSCPTFLENFDELYSPRGYLHLCQLVQEKKIQPSKQLKEILLTCTQCGDCEPVCPIHLPIVQIIADTLKK